MMFRRRREEFGDSHLEAGQPPGGRSGMGAESVLPYLLDALRVKPQAPCASTTVPVSERTQGRTPAEVFECGALRVIERHVELRSECQAALQDLQAEVLLWRLTVDHAASALEAATGQARPRLRPPQ